MYKAQRYEIVGQIQGMARCHGWSVGNERKCDGNETGVCSLLSNAPKPRQIKARTEGWIDG